MSLAVRIHRHGGPDTLATEQVEVGNPGPGEALIHHTAIGVNFIDVYFRTGLYSAPAMPFTPGMEGAGVVAAVGTGVTAVRPGDRVAYGSAPIGSYCERRLIPADRLVPIPDGVDERTAAAAILKGMTARYLLRSTHPVQAGDTILFHAAAGGVGLIACQWAAALGARVIGTVGSRAKADLAGAHGCHHPIVYTATDFVAAVHEITGGAGVPVAFDSVGRATFMRSLDCLARRGHLVSFGQSSGRIEALDIGILAAKGSLSLTRPTLADYVATRDELLAAAGELLAMVADGRLRIRVGECFRLADAARAHEALEGRRTSGSIVLLPD